MIKIFFLIVSSIPAVSVIAQSDPSSLDSSIRHGKLSNGFEYYIKSVDKPLSKLYLDLNVKAGINQEEEGQSNFAHTIEHLAFKATKNFPMGIRDSLKDLNIPIADFSGSSGETTNYYFKVPIDNPVVLDIALVWFKDIATGLKLKEKEINQVRGELKEEFLLKSGDNLNESFAISSLKSKLFPGSKNMDNIFQHLESYSSGKLRQFYRGWYRPDLMTISVIGNIEDVDAVEELLVDMYSNIQLPENPKALPDSDAAYYKRSPQFAIVERKIDTNLGLEDRSVRFQLFYREPSILGKIHTLDGVKRLIKLKLLINIINKRLTALTNGYNSFNAISLDRFSYSNLPPLLEVRLKMFSGEKQALQKTIRALHQLQEYGVLEQEWEEIQEGYIRKMNFIYKNKVTYWRNEIFNHFKYDEALPSDKHKSLENWLSNLTLESFNDYVHQFLSDMPEDIGVMAPTGHKALSLTEKEMRFWITEAFNKTVMPYKLPKTSKALMSNESVTKLKRNIYEDMGMGKSGARKLILTNGIKVILKPNKHITPGKIKLHGFSSNGAKCFPNKSRSSTLNAANIVRNSGVGTMDKFMLNRFLSNTSVNVYPYTGFMETGITGSAASEEVGKMFQLIYLYFTAPRLDKTAYNDWKLGEKINYLNPTYGLIQTDFSNRIREITGNNFLGRSSNNFTRWLMGTKRLESTINTDMETAYITYNKLYGKAKDFTFIITGDYAFESIIPFIQKYLGNLPNTSKLSKCTSRKVNSSPVSEGPIYKEIAPPDYYTLKNVSYDLRFISKVENTGNWKEQIKVEILGQILGKLGWNLRFNKGYNIYLISGFGEHNIDMNRYEIGYNLSCSNNEMKSLSEECKQIISRIKSGIISEYIFESSRNKVLNQRESEQNRLYEHFHKGQPWISSTKRKQFIESLTINDIVEIANKFCKVENQFEFVLKNKKPL